MIDTLYQPYYEVFVQCTPPNKQSNVEYILWNKQRWNEFYETHDLWSQKKSPPTDAIFGAWLIHTYAKDHPRVLRTCSKQCAEAYHAYVPGVGLSYSSALNSAGIYCLIAGPDVAEYSVKVLPSIPSKSKVKPR